MAKARSAEERQAAARDLYERSAKGSQVELRPKRYTKRLVGMTRPQMRVLDIVLHAVLALKRPGVYIAAHELAGALFRVRAELAGRARSKVEQRRRNAIAARMVRRVTSQLEEGGWLVKVPRFRDVEWEVVDSRGRTRRYSRKQRPNVYTLGPKARVLWPAALRVVESSLCPTNASSGSESSSGTPDLTSSVSGAPFAPSVIRGRTGPRAREPWPEGRVDLDAASPRRAVQDQCSDLELQAYRRAATRARAEIAAGWLHGGRYFARVEELVRLENPDGLEWSEGQEACRCSSCREVA